VPMLDVYVPEGALRPDAEAALLGRLTDILIRHEGFDPTDPATRAVSWAFLHRPVAVHVGGVPADEPRSTIVVTVPEGQLDRSARESVVAEVTEAVLDAEEGARPGRPPASGSFRPRSRTATGEVAVASRRCRTSSSA
jgi:phenylpyruvate tautomerase PptA (4-oxalocrotonate tautomerase family)